MKTRNSVYSYVEIPKRALFSALVGLVGFWGSAAIAQDGIANLPIREQLETVQAPVAAPRPRLRIEGGVERSPCALADPQYAEIRVTISNITFNNLKGATAEEMEPAWLAFAGQPQPVSVICEIRDAAATILRNKGYLAAVEVPTQRITDGNIQLETLYARVIAIRARGQTGGVERKLEDYLGGLAQDEIFDRDKAERSLLLVSDLPGYNVQLTLIPAGTVPGELIGEVLVLRQPYELNVSVHNLAATGTGPWGAQISGQFYGITGLGDATTLALYAAPEIEDRFREQLILQVGHAFRPGSGGLLVQSQFAYAWTNPGQAENGPEIAARTLFVSLGGNYPLVRSQGQNVRLGAGIDYVDQNITLITLLSRDKMRVGWAKAEYDAIDLGARTPRWGIGGTVEIRQALPVLGATDGCGFICTGDQLPTSRADGQDSSTVLRASALLDLRLSQKFELAVAARAQYAFGPLLSFEEFTAGNLTVGRGYDPGTLAGDRAVAGTAELRYAQLSLSENPEVQFQPYVFGDCALVWNIRDGVGTERVFSAGLGLRARIASRITLDASGAVPMERAGLLNQKGSPRFLLTLNTRVLPWRRG